MTARRRYKLPGQYAPSPSVRSRWPLCLNLGGSFLYKESGERKEGEYKRCGALPGRTELNPRLLPTERHSQLILVGNSDPTVHPRAVALGHSPDSEALQIDRGHQL
jgi:hypothetical protein